ncbi:amino acid ABC transporter permease [Cupriavidus sp. CV2]|uniref:amino acid ABC transporter permease n=1 Tax=Cupriavidus ulmosensis TaxID=3065913 RepID=UPI00296AD4A2|nr:amino acid ABC transporter permease [Cupriavidus sp. CV2]MDW3686009.1 amino acid ABC transporter permease [Cupriavidus sp. CV2]
MDYHFDYSPVIAAIPDLLRGCLGTLWLALAGMVLAMVIALAGVIARRSHSRPAQTITIAFVEAIRNTPFLVQIYFIFFALPALGVTLNPTVAAILALGVNGGAYAIEIVRGGVEAIHKGQIEAGLALGLRRSQIFRYVVLKPALRAIYPSLTSQFILLTLTTSIASSISANELTSIAKIVESNSFRSFEVYSAVIVLYLAMSWLLMVMFAGISRHWLSYPSR